MYVHPVENVHAGEEGSLVPELNCKTVDADTLDRENETNGNAGKQKGKGISMAHVLDNQDGTCTVWLVARSLIFLFLFNFLINSLLNAW